MNTPIMKAYEIFYFAPKDMKIDDIYNQYRLPRNLIINAVQEV